MGEKTRSFGLREMKNNSRNKKQGKCICNIHVQDKLHRNCSILATALGSWNTPTKDHLMRKKHPLNLFSAVLMADQLDKVDRNQVTKCQTCWLIKWRTSDITAATYSYIDLNLERHRFFLVLSALFFLFFLPTLCLQNTASQSPQVTSFDEI